VRPWAEITEAGQKAIGQNCTLHLLLNTEVQAVALNNFHLLRVTDAAREPGHVHSRLNCCLARRDHRRVRVGPAD
jgi:hypothetical protein